MTSAPIATGGPSPDRGGASCSASSSSSPTAAASPPKQKNPRGRPRLDAASSARGNAAAALSDDRRRQLRHAQKTYRQKKEAVLLNSQTRVTELENRLQLITDSISSFHKAARRGRLHITHPILYTRLFVLSRIALPEEEIVFDNNNNGNDNENGEAPVPQGEASSTISQQRQQQPQHQQLEHPPAPPPEPPSSRLPLREASPNILNHDSGFQFLPPITQPSTTPEDQILSPTTIFGLKLFGSSPCPSPSPSPSPPPTFLSHSHSPFLPPPHQNYHHQQHEQPPPPPIISSTSFFPTPSPFHSASQISTPTPYLGLPSQHPDQPNHPIGTHSYSHHEPHFHRRLQRHSLEYAFRILTNPDRFPPQTTFRVFRLVACLQDHEHMTPHFRRHIRTVEADKGTLDLLPQKMPFYGVGGAGTHFDADGRMLADGFGMVGGARRRDDIQGWRLPGKLIGMPPRGTTDDRSEGDREEERKKRLETLGFGGEWFDCKDVEGWVGWRGGSLGNNGNRYAVVEGGREDGRRWVLDVEAFIDELLPNMAILGRAPAFRKQGVESAFLSSLRVQASV